MKHFSPAPRLLTEQELVVEIAGRLDGRQGEQGRLAGQVGISQAALSNLLTNGRGAGPSVAAALGFRKVVRFERIE